MPIRKRPLFHHDAWEHADDDAPSSIDDQRVMSVSISLLNERRCRTLRWPSLSMLRAARASITPAHRRRVISPIDIDALGQRAPKARRSVMMQYWPNGGSRRYLSSRFYDDFRQMVAEMGRSWPRRGGRCAGARERAKRAAAKSVPPHFVLPQSRGRFHGICHDTPPTSDGRRSPN